MQAKKRHLADPRERPAADIVIYDGHCRFCTGQVQRLAKWDQTQRLAFLSLHDRRAAELCADLTHDQMMQQLYLVTSTGKRFGGASAIRYLSRHMPWLWILAPLLHIPGSLPLWQWFYNLVAKRRYRLGRLDANDSDANDSVACDSVANDSDACDGGACDVHLK